MKKSNSRDNHEMQRKVIDFRLSPRYGIDLHSSEITRNVKWQFLTDVSGQPICPIFKGQEILYFNKSKISRNFWIS
jgi:hypothetical protein